MAIIFHSYFRREELIDSPNVMAGPRVNPRIKSGAGDEVSNFAMSWPGEGAVVSGAGGLTRPSRRKHWDHSSLDARLKAGHDKAGSVDARLNPPDWIRGRA